MLHSDSNKAQKDLNKNVNWKMFRITVDYFGGNLTSNIEINVLLNRRPKCLFHQPMAVIMLRATVITVQKNFYHYYRPGTRLLVQSLKSHKLTSNACQDTFFSLKFDAIAVPLLTPIVCEQQYCYTF